MSIESGSEKGSDISRAIDHAFERIYRDVALLKQFENERRGFLLYLEDQIVEAGYDGTDAEKVEAWWELQQGTPPDDWVSVENSRLTEIVHKHIIIFLDDFLARHGL
ncbi:MAG: hypothetical protein KC877_02360 [Candidatus Kaiserbacteria bacterium]|nr:hypothetical protein [Candidatus Kaiserbacteria bacterium]MCB9816086.1 hypothetical protein [Candidatus Nomurabacteria bacterium]